MAMAMALALFASQYGFDRDELYFRMLPPAWGYVDQPPLTPLLTRLLSISVADEPWATRIPAIVFATASVPVIALIAREAGGGRVAQGLAAWGYAFGSMTLSMGHVFLTSSLDLLVWPAVSLLVMRAVCREEARWWIWVGVLVGLSTYNKFLVAMLLVSLGAGIAVLGPRRALGSRGLWLGVAIALVLAAPNILYQVLNGWPQLKMGAALSVRNAATVRIIMWPMLLLMLGPLLVPIWLAGLYGLARRPGWRRLRFLLAAFPVLLGLVWLSGGQFYYPYGLLVVIYALGCVPTAELAARHLAWRVLTVAAVVTNSAAAAIISLPVIPVQALGSTVIPKINPLVGDQVGWPAYVGEIEQVVANLPEAGSTAILTSNYGEAGALSRFGQALLPSVYSGHNELFRFGPPTETVDRVVVVGGMLPRVAPFFSDCPIKLRLDDQLNVANEEQALPVAVCEGRKQSWAIIWPALQHLD